MYLNEQSWHEKSEDSYFIDMKIRKFLDVSAEIKRKNSQEEIFVDVYKRQDMDRQNDGI